MSKPMIRPNPQQSAVFGLVALSLFLVIQSLLVYLLLPSGRQYALHWQPYHVLLKWWMGASIFLLPVAGISGVVVVARSMSIWRLRMAMVLLGASLLLAVISIAFWYGLALGNGSGTVVAQADHGDTVYLLEYAVVGDPPTTRYDLRECSQDRIWCRPVGGIYGYLRPMGAEPAAIDRGLDGSFTIVIGGSVRAIVKEGQVDCRDTDTLFCHD